MFFIPVSHVRIQELVSVIFKRIEHSTDWTEKETELTHAWHQLFGIKQVIDEAEHDLMVNATVRQDFVQYHEFLLIQSHLYEALMRIEEMFEAHLQQKTSR